MTETLRPLGWTGPTGAKITEHLHYIAATDNRMGRGQTIVNGVAEVYDWQDNQLFQESGWTGLELSLVDGLGLFPRGHKARYLVINKLAGTSTLYYAAGYHPAQGYIGLKRDTFTDIFDPEVMGPHILFTLWVTNSDKLEV